MISNSFHLIFRKATLLTSHLNLYHRHRKRSQCNTLHESSRLFNDVEMFLDEQMQKASFKEISGIGDIQVVSKTMSCSVLMVISACHQGMHR